MNPRRELDLLVCAATFLTRVPMPEQAGFQPDWIARSTRYASLVGQSVGLICALVWLVANAIWPGLPAAAMTIGAGMLVTGGFHEDGLADTADGLGGGQTAEQRLAIMKDSRIGSFGALALVVVTLAKIALLARLGPWSGVLALIVAHGGGRAMAIVVMTVVPYARDPDASKLKPAPQGVRWSEAAMAAAIGLWPLLLMDAQHALFGLALAIMASVTLTWIAYRLIKGVTGDVLGAVEQLAETAFLMGATAWVF